MTDHELKELSERMFIRLIESAEFDALLPPERTIFMARFAAHAANYAADARSF